MTWTMRNVARETKRARGPQPGSPPDGRTTRLRRTAVPLLALATIAAAVADPADAAPGVLATRAPAQLRDGDAGASGSLAAGATTYLVRGDFDGDGTADVVNVTARGAQVLLRDGLDGSLPRFRHTQDIEVLYGEGGGAIDVDSDGDLDLVLGDVRSLVVAENDGTGRFRLDRVLAHGFRQPAVAIPFRRFAAPGTAGDAVRVVLGASAESVTGDRIRRNRARRPVVYVLERGERTWRVVQALDALNLDGVAARDFDGDGDTDLVLTDRSGRSGVPVRAYRAQGDGYAPGPAVDTGEYEPAFAFGPVISERGDLAVGSWHAAAYFPRLGTSWTAPVVVALGGTGVSPRGDVSATAFADMDLDGDEDLVAGGSSSALELVSFDDGETAARFLADAAEPGVSDLIAADWDGDLGGTPDVLTGGPGGLWFHANANGTAPVAPAPRTALHRVVGAARGAAGAVAPGGLASDGARAGLTAAIRQLGRIDDGFVTAGTIPGADRRARIAHLRAWHDQAVAARASLQRATASSPAAAAEVEAARAAVVEACEALVLRAFETEGPGVRIPDMPRPARTAIAAALRARARMQDAVATSRIDPQPGTLRRATTRAALEGATALARLAACVAAVERD